jgi:hypothetical protein
MFQQSHSTNKQVYTTGNASSNAVIAVIGVFLTTSSWVRILLAARAVIDTITDPKSRLTQCVQNPISSLHSYTYFSASWPILTGITQRSGVTDSSLSWPSALGGSNLLTTRREYRLDSRQESLPELMWTECKRTDEAENCAPILQMSTLEPIQ